MKDIKIKDIINITGGKLILGNEEEICENFSNDTRNSTTNLAVQKNANPCP